MVILFLLPVLAEHDEAVAQRGIAGGNSAGFAPGAKVLARIEAERPGVADRPGLAALVEGALGLGGILDHDELVPGGDFHDGIHVRTLAEQMHGHDRPGARRDGGLDLGDIDGERADIDVDKDRFRPGIRDGLRRRHEGHGHCDNFIAGSDAEGEQGEPE